jgi:hypothetical protein
MEKKNVPRSEKTAQVQEMLTLGCSETKAATLRAGAYLSLSSHPLFPKSGTEKAYKKHFLSEKVDGWMDGWTGRWMDGWTGKWMEGWVDGWMNGWMDGWTGRWMDGDLDSLANEPP